MEAGLIDSPVLSAALDVANHGQESGPAHETQREVAREATFESRMAIDVHDAANVPVDFSGKSADIDLQKSLMSAYNDGLGALVNNRC